MSSEPLASLRPHETIQRILISTTPFFIGEYLSENILISLAFNNFGDKSGFARRLDGPTSRHGIMVSFRTGPLVKEAGFILPNYEGSGRVFCAYLAILFGKRFDSHGPIETNGYFWTPEMSVFAQLCNHATPYNSRVARADYPIPLNLEEFRRLSLVFSGAPIDAKALHTFLGSATFYLRALQSADSDVEVAYMHLITAGEILSNGIHFDKENLLDEATKQLLQRIESEMPGGAKAANALKGKLRQVKRRFVLAITALVDRDFFSRSEAAEKINALKEDDFAKNISAAYDLRSRYVHDGIAFGPWVSPRELGANVEVNFGKPVVDAKDKEFGDVLHRSPTFVGLERVIRYAILKFAEQNKIVEL